MLLAKMTGKRASGYRRYLRERQTPAVSLFGDEQQAAVTTETSVVNHLNIEEAATVVVGDLTQREQDNQLRSLYKAVKGAKNKPAGTAEWLSAETRQLLAAKAAALRANQSERVHEYGKAL